MVLVEQEERVAAEMSCAAARKHVSSACVVTCPTALQRILRPDMALAVWQRSLANEVVAELESLELDEVDDILLASGTDALERALVDAMEQAGYSDMPAFRQDITMLASQHAAITGDYNVRIRLKVVETDACRKFHSDYVKVRTITTYLGQGTQWIEAESADRADLPDSADIRQLDAGDVGIFKGRLLQETPTILHRSPPIGGSDQQRLVLVIDPASREDELAIRVGGTCSRAWRRSTDASEPR